MLLLLGSQMDSWIFAARWRLWRFICSGQHRTELSRKVQRSPVTGKTMMNNKCSKIVKGREASSGNHLGEGLLSSNSIHRITHDPPLVVDGKREEDPGVAPERSSHQRANHHSVRPQAQGDKHRQPRIQRADSHKVCNATHLKFSFAAAGTSIRSLPFFHRSAYALTGKGVESLPLVAHRHCSAPTKK